MPKEKDLTVQPGGEPAGIQPELLNILNQVAGGGFPVNFQLGPVIHKISHNFPSPDRDILSGGDLFNADVRNVDGIDSNSSLGKPRFDHIGSLDQLQAFESSDGHGPHHIYLCSVNHQVQRSPDLFLIPRIQFPVRDAPEPKPALAMPLFCSSI